MDRGSRHGGPPRRLARRWPGFLLIGLGLAVAGFGAAYLIYAEIARSKLDELEATVPEEVRAAWFEPPASRPTPTTSSVPPTPASVIGTASAASTQGRATPIPASTPASGTAAPAPGEPVVFDFSGAHPAAFINPKYWGEPLWAGSDPYGGPGLPEDFEFVSGFNAARRIGTLPSATRVSIPSIGVDSEVRELEILDLGDSRAYETPAYVVGHIPGTANPGENGNGWYFGHLESPGRNEGNVFYRLPDIAKLLKQDPIDVIVENDRAAYLYRVISTRVVHQDDMTLFEAPRGTITLVACVPSRVYDHRLLVTAELIAERR
ncbi:MAG: sortase [Chloroflexi bacterium]|nr:sortase [Chloroflexota bacterium]